MKSLFEQMGGKYIKIGDYYFPDLGQFDEEEEPIDNRPIGKYGMLRDIQEQAQQLLDTLIPQYKEKQGITEELKFTDQMEWARLMNIAHSICGKFIFDRIIYK